MKDLEIELPVVTVGALGTDPSSRTFAVVAPIMSNAVAVNNGEELFLDSTVKKGTKRKEGSWKTDVARAEKAQTVRAKAKTAASSLEVVTEI